MRNIYSDEAGISATEPVAVVVAITVEPDTQWRPAVAQMARLITQSVPEKYVGQFALHAKTLVRQRTYPEWDMSARYALLRAVMRIPRLFGMPLSVGAVKRGSGPLSGNTALTNDEQVHLMAFALCMTSADELVRTYCGQEMVQVIAEDHPDMKRFLRGAVNTLRFQPMVLPAKIFRKDTAPELITHTYRIDRLLDEVHFMDRLGSPLLQVADACAFGFRRFLSQQSYGSSYMEEMLGMVPEMPEQWTTHHRNYFRLAADGKLFNAVIERSDGAK